MTSRARAAFVRLSVAWMLAVTASSNLHADDFAAVPLTDEEREWLERRSVIRVAQDPDWPPIEYVESDGTFGGIGTLYLAVLEERLGTKFESVPVESWTEALDALRNRKAEMAAALSETAERSEYLEFTRPYLRIPIAIVTERQVTYVSDIRELRGKTLATVEGYAITEWLTSDHPGIVLKHVPNTEEGLALVNGGEVFGYVDNMAAIGYYLSKLNLVNLKVTGQTGYENALCMAARKDLPILAGILQKTLDTLTEAEHAEIRNRLMPLQIERGFDFSLIRRILTAAIVIFIALLYWILRLRNEIARRKKIELALSESENRFRTLYENTTHGIMFLDGTGKIISANPAVSKILGMPEEKIIGGRTADPAWETVHEDGSSFPSGEHPASRTLSTGMPERGIIGIKTPGSTEYRWLNVHSGPVISDGTDSGRQIFATVEDITERKNGERAILAAQEETRRLLEETDRSRKALLSMVEDQKAVEENIRKLLAEKEMLLKEVHHRIKNNMSSIHGLLTLQAQAQTDPSAVKVLRDAATRVQSMVILYDKLYRSDAIRDISLQAYFPPLVEEIASQYPNRGSVSIVKDIENVILAANYVFSLGIIITELTTNAMKYAFVGREKGTIRISASRKDNHLLIVFEDDGTGMPEPPLPAGSSGFGLKLLTMLVSQIDGSLLVESSSGTRFTLTFDA